jgi:predicted dehydrogenase
MSQFTRRDFVKKAAASASLMAIPSILTARAAEPSKQLTLGMIGVGGMGKSHVSDVLKIPDCRILAVCDVDATHLKRAKERVDSAYGNKDCATFSDFRALNQRKDIDAVIIATPDNWHVLPALDALSNGKHIYVEKPLSLTIHEGQVLVAALRKSGLVGQTGTQQRSSGDFRKAADLIRNGRLGKIERVEIFIPPNNKISPGLWAAEPPPEGLDWNFWLGPAPKKPFTRQGCHYNFRFISDYARGQITNWGTHYVDITQWALDMDESGPVEAVGSGAFPTTGLFSNAMHLDVTLTYANGIPLRIQSRKDIALDGNVCFYGEKGWIDVSRSRLKASDDKLLSEPLAAGGTRVKVSNDHHRDFFDSIRTGSKPVADIAYGHRTNTVCIIADIAMRLGRKVKWDPAKEEFIDDLLANRMKGRAMRAPWALV